MLELARVMSRNQFRKTMVVIPFAAEEYGLFGSSLYLKEMAAQYQPGFDVHMVFRHDRFGRGGDHSPFNATGYAAVRITTPMENFSHQHNATDTFENTAPAYTALVAKANAAAFATLAAAPKPPDISTPPPNRRARLRFAP